MSYLKPIRLAAWGLLALVVILTLAPIGVRPETVAPPTIERFAAFAAIGVAFAIAYPRQFWFAAVVTLGAALLLEALQLLAPTRHGRMFDAAVKLAAGTAGLLLALVLQRLQGLIARLRNFG